MVSNRPTQSTTDTKFKFTESKSRQHVNTLNGIHNEKRRKEKQLKWNCCANEQIGQTKMKWHEQQQQQLTTSTGTATTQFSRLCRVIFGCTRSCECSEHVENNSVFI